MTSQEDIESAFLGKNSTVIKNVQNNLNEKRYQPVRHSISRYVAIEFELVGTFFDKNFCPLCKCLLLAGGCKCSNNGDKYLSKDIYTLHNIAFVLAKSTSSYMCQMMIHTLEKCS